MVAGVIAFLVFIAGMTSGASYPKDVIRTSDGNLEITFIGHGTLMLEFEDKVIHIDPVKRFGDYSELPLGDLILISHGHGDHFDAETIQALRKETTQVVVPPNLSSKVKSSLPNGETDPGKLVELLSDQYNIEVRIRPMR